MAGWSRYQGFIGPSYTSQSRLADAEDLINWFVERMESQNAKVPYALYPCPGVETRVDTGVTPNRGLFSEQGRAFAVNGGKLKEFDAGFNITERGDLTEDGNPVTWATNGDGGDQLMVTSGNKGYILNLTTGLLTLTVPNAVINGALMCGMLNTRFIVLDADASKFAASDIYAGLTYNAFMFAQRSTASDPWKAMRVSTDTAKIYLIGEKTSDVYYDNGNSPFPFAPITGALIPWGTDAPFTVAEHQGRPIWLAQNKDGDRVVVRLSGYTSAERVSNHALERALSSYTRVSDARGFTYQQEGHEFYVLTIPSARISWVFDDEGGWHKRSTYNVAEGHDDIWRASAHAVAFSKHIVGDLATGNLSELSPNYGLDFGGGPLRRVRRTPGIIRGLERIFYPGLRIYVDPGLPPIAGQGATPTMLYRHSNNGGRTWGDYRQGTLPKQGEYFSYIEYLLNGSGVDRVDEIVVSDPLPWRLMDAELLGAVA